MTQKQFLLIAVLCNIVFLFLYIFKQNALISLKQQLQKTDEKSTQLQQQKKKLYTELQKLQQHETIKKRAEKELGMRKASLNQITPLPLPTDHDNHI